MNGGIHTERKVGNRDRERSRIGSGESEHESLLVHENTPKYTRNNQLNLCSEQGKLAYCIRPYGTQFPLPYILYEVCKYAQFTTKT